MKRSGRNIALLGAVVITLAAAAWLFLGSDDLGENVEAQAGPFHVSTRFEPNPPQPGKNTLSLKLTDAEGAPVEDAAIHAEATMPAMGAMPEMKAGGQATARGGGRYELSFELSMSGTWPLSLHIHSPSGGDATLEFDYKTGVPVRLASHSAAGTASGAPTPFTCSMHPSVRENAPGTCPICSMDLTPVAPSEGEPDETAHYTCSMHPSVRSNTPGTCPICSMDLTPVTHGELQSGTIRVDEKQRQLIGVTTAPIERQAAALTLRAVGRVTYDETRLADITLKFQGWVGEVFADATGMPVKENESLFTVYAPELLSAQEEFLESARRARTETRTTSRLLQNARQRLLLWNLTESQVEELARTGKPAVHLPIHSPVSGIVIEKNIVAGSAVAAGQRLYRIADLSHVWVVADVYEADLPLVRVGEPAAVTLSYLPGESFAGTIDYVYPYLDAPTRTGRIRIVVPNPEGALKPDMYADVELSVSLGEQLLVPEGAVIRAGQTNVAFVDLGEGRLKPRTLELGRRTPEGYVVHSGLEPGDVVVTSGNFLIAAESKLKAGVDKW